MFAVEAALNKEKEKKVPAFALELKDGTIITGKQSKLLTATSAALLNSIKYLAGVKDQLKLLSPNIIEPICKLKEYIYKEDNTRLNAEDVLTALSINATTNAIVEETLSMLPLLKNTEAHSTVMLNYEDEKVLKKLQINLTTESITNK